MSPKLQWSAVLGVLFVGRLLFGISSEFWSEDETQIFLMGLRYYATGEWPYFGPDIVWTKSEIPGALQPLLVGLPLRAVALPESPFVLLNVLSFAALCALAWYICRRLPSLPRWLVCGWLLTIPWTLQFSTHVNNPSYVLPAAIVFFLGFFEAVPSLSIGVLPPRWAFLMMGAAIGWIMQIHMSWPLLLPFAAIAVHQGATARREGIHRVVWFIAGAAGPALLLLPTLLQYGVRAGSGGSTSNLHLHLVSPDRLLITLAQFFSFASLEINRFIAIDNAKRWVFLQEHLWIVPLAAIASAAAVAQPIWMLASWFRRVPGVREWPSLRVLVAFTVALVYISYWFVLEEPQAHAFYAVAPVAFIFAAYCWRLIDSPRWRRVAAVALAVNIALHIGLAVTQAPEQSLYRNRPVVANAIRYREPEMFGHRRPFSIDAGPVALADPSRPYDIKDLVVEETTVRVAVARATAWRVTLTNANPRVAFRNMIYITTYVDGEGATVHQHQDVIKDVLQPEETKAFRVIDTIVRPPFQNATLKIVAAEALLPIRH
jgi:hypothetical protein